MSDSPTTHSNAESPAKRACTNAEEAARNNDTKAEPPAKRARTNAEEAARNNDTNAEEAARNNDTNAEEAVRNNDTNAEEAARNNDTNAEEAARNNDTNAEEAARNNDTNAEEAARNNDTNAEEAARNNDTNAEEAARNDDTNVEAAARNNDILMEINRENQLDHLHMSHLRQILDYLSITDIMGSMTVSKQWQANILEYLQGSRFCFEYYHLPRTHFVPRLLGLVDEVRHRRALPFHMSHGDLRGFQTKVVELGPAIVSLILDYIDETSLNIITENCPNLQDLMLVGLQLRRVHEPQGPSGQPPLDQQRAQDSIPSTEEVRRCLQQLKLKSISFVHSPNIPENCIGEFLMSDSVEEIVICRNRLVEGRCLSHLESNLKNLRLIACSLNFGYLNAVADRLAALTMLDLSNNPSEILRNVHHLLGKTANLEFLFLDSYEQTNVGNDFVISLSRLSRLKHLSLCWNDNVSDEWLEAVALGCARLETVDIETKSPMYNLLSERNGMRRVVTANGVLALCRGAPLLAHLGLAGLSAVGDQQLAACVAVCPDLESLDLRGCGALAAPLGELARAARGPARAAARAAAAAAANRAPRPPKPLRLRLARTYICIYRQAPAPEGLIYDFVDAPRTFRLV